MDPTGEDVLERVLLIVVLLVALAGCAGCGGNGDASGCSEDADCPPGRYCQLASGTCVYDCTHDIECPLGYRCTARGRCEEACEPTNGGVEDCDGVDNDCDGSTDEELEDRPCHRENEHGRCDGTGACVDGQWVCEAAVPVPEECDGLDNDCDGATDEDLTASCPLTEGVCAGAERSCLGQQGWTECDYGPDHEPGEETRCDGLDNDCDGATDEDLTRGDCVNENEHGSCAGVEVCEAGDWVCDAPVPEAEQCDGVDNDCDGLTDEGADPTDTCEIGAAANDGIDNNCDGMTDEPGGCMVRVTFGEVDAYIDVYESTVYTSSRCTGTAYGQAANDYPAEWQAGPGPAGVTLYACSVPDVRPSAWITLHQARRACQAHGKRLCTKAEWSVACGGTELLEFTYGSSYEPEACNTFSAGNEGSVQAGSMEDCLSPFGTYDMSGNLWEWVAEVCDWDINRHAIQGGAFHCEYCDENDVCTDCDLDNPDHQDTIDSRHRCHYPNQSWWCAGPMSQTDRYGFRCCMDPP